MNDFAPTGDDRPEGSGDPPDPPGPPDRARWAVAAGVVLALTVVTLRLLGRPWWCELGDLLPGTLQAEGRHTSQHLLDPYTFTHVLHGVVFYGLLWAALRERAGLAGRALLALVLESGWEVLENTNWIIERYRTAALAHDYFGDAVLNSLADVAACMGGFALAWRLPVRASIAVYVAVELALLATIGDGLTLNVVHLLGG